MRSSRRTNKSTPKDLGIDQAQQNRRVCGHCISYMLYVGHDFKSPIRRLDCMDFLYQAEPNCRDCIIIAAEIQVITVLFFNGWPVDLCKAGVGWASPFGGPVTRRLASERRVVACLCWRTRLWVWVRPILTTFMSKLSVAIFDLLLATKPKQLSNTTITKTCHSHFQQRFPLRFHLLLKTSATHQ